jgi:type I site-specific restriction-modification system R (restriction) subunit
VDEIQLVPGTNQKRHHNMMNFTESVVEDAALAWLESLGYAIKHGPELAPGELIAERGDYGQVLLATRLREALARLNPGFPAEAIDDAFRKIIRLEGATLDARNRTLHRLLVDSVTVECRADGAIRGTQAQLMDFDDPNNNGWLAVNRLLSSRTNIIADRFACQFKGENGSLVPEGDAVLYAALYRYEIYEHDA